MIGKVNREGILPTVVVEDKREYIPLLLFGDGHVGLDTSRLDLQRKIVKRAKEENWLWVGMGDYIECATYQSPAGGMHHQTIHAQEQVKTFLKLVEPIKDQCIGLLAGNHGDRVRKPTGVDAIELVADMLGVNYLGWETSVFIKRKLKNWGCSYALYAAHTASASKSPGLSANWIERELGGWLDSFDIIARGHSHDISYTPIQIVQADLVHHSVRTRFKYLVNIGHFCGRPDYIRKGSKRPKPDGTVLLTLRMNRKRGVSPTFLYEEDL